MSSLGIFALAAAARWTWQHELPRSSSIVQQKPIADGIVMRIDRLNIMTYPEHGSTVLQVYCTFLGSNPRADYAVNVSIHPLGEKQDPNPGNGQGVASGYDTADAFPRLWECRPPPPESTKFIVVGVLLHPWLSSPAQSDHYVEFTVPYFPTHIPRGSPEA